MTLSVIDEAPYSKFHRKLVLLSAGGPFLDGYILTIIGVVIVAVQKQLGLGSTEFGLVGAAALVGLFVGGLGFGRLTDIIGRKLMYTLDLAALLIGSALCLFVQEGWQLIALRFVLGVAIGADYPIATAMLSEWLPRRERGRCMGLLMAWWFIGACVASAVGFIMMQTMGDDAWRWVLASAALPTLLIMIARHGTPESPRWLIAKGQREEARESIIHALGHECTETELDVLAADETPSGMGFWATFRKPYGKRTLFVSLFWTFQIIPLFGLYTFGPTILDAFNVSGGSLLGSVLISLMFLVGLAPGIMLIDRVGRRPLIVGSFALMTVPPAILGLVPDAAASIVVVCFCFYALASGGPASWSGPTRPSCSPPRSGAPPSVSRPQLAASAQQSAPTYCPTASSTSASARQCSWAPASPQQASWSASPGPPRPRDAPSPKPRPSGPPPRPRVWTELRADHVAGGGRHVTRPPDQRRRVRKSPSKGRNPRMSTHTVAKSGPRWTVMSTAPSPRRPDWLELGKSSLRRCIADHQSALTIVKVEA